MNSASENLGDQDRLRLKIDNQKTLDLLRAAFMDAAREVPDGLVDDSGRRGDSKDDFFHEFLLIKGNSFADDLALCTSNAGRRALVRRIAKTWLQDRARTRSDSGSHRHSIEKVMRARKDLFVQRPGSATWWGLAGFVEDFTGDPRVLREAAASVLGMLKGRRGNETTRNALAPHHELARLLESILEAAGGFVAISALNQTVEQRIAPFQVSSESLDALLELDGPRRQRALQAIGVSEEVDVPETGTIEAAADVLWSSMSGRERLIAGQAKEPSAVQTTLGLGRSRASEIANQLLVRYENSGEDVVREMLRTHVNVERDRTPDNSVRQKTLQKTSPSEPPSARLDVETDEGAVDV